MEKTNVEILDFEDKEAVSGKKYTRFQTNQGWMSAFDKSVIDSLKLLKGKIASVTIAHNVEKGFKNIRAFHGVATQISDLPAAPRAVMETKPLPQEHIGTPKKGFNSASMYASYAKDIFCSITSQTTVMKAGKEMDLKQVMQMSIDLVKQAREAFE